MYANTGAMYGPGCSPLARVGAFLKHASRAAWLMVVVVTFTGVGRQRLRTPTRTVLSGWLSSPFGALVARRRARCGWAPVFWVVMPPGGPLMGTPFSPVISNGVIQRLRTE